MRLRLLRIVSLVAVLVPAVALGQPSLQSQKIGSAEASVPTYVLDGIVLNLATGEPVGTALVQIYSLGQRSVLTGPDGKFRFEGLPQGQVAVSARKPGFINEQQFASGETHSNVVQVGPIAQSVVLRLVPEGLIYGRITDSDGEPVENLGVKLMCAAIVNGKKQWQQRRGVQTNEDGDFRLFELPPGAYYLKAGPSFNFRLRPSSYAHEGLPGTYYPGVRDLDEATVITIVPGSRIRADFEIRPETFYKVSGTVVSAPLSPVNIAFLNLEGDALPSAIQINPSGEFVAASIPAGAYLIRAFAEGKDGQQTVASLPVKVNSDIAGVHLVLSPTATIPVEVRFEVTRNSHLESFPKDIQPVNIQLVSIGDTSAIRGNWANTQGPPENKSFAIWNVEPGTYGVQVTANGPWYVDSARCDNTDLLSQELTVRSGGVGQPIKIALRDDFASLDGTISSGEHLAPGTVLLIPERNPEGAVTIPVGATGQFQAGTLAPGNYRAFAFNRVDGLEYANPAAMQTYIFGEEFVRLVPNGQATVNLKLQEREN
jgi:hypothetical protein